MYYYIVYMQGWGAGAARSGKGGGGNILPYLTNSQEPETHVFCPLKPEPLEKNYRSQSPLGKKSGAGVA